MRLIIVESPAKCSKIQGFLGLGNKVIASMGHIRSLVHDLDAIGIDRGFEPKYEFMKEKAKAIAELKAAAKGAETIVLCADDDREGEAIAYSIALLLKLNVATNPRAAFREITRKAVLDAVDNPRTIDMNRVNSQQARAMLDMMVGFTISPLLWKHVGPALSAGRCQTPALRLVCEREAVIEKFKSESSWAVTGTWSLATTGSPTWPATMLDSLEDSESAMNYLENHSGSSGGKVKSVTQKPWLSSAPQALMTSTLQQQVSNLYKCNPKRTMQIAQKLYEAGHITYMRTDITTMSEEAVAEAKKVVESKWGKPYVALVMTKKDKDKKKDGKDSGTAQPQEAHEAIRPTHFENSQIPDKEDWGSQDRKIYHLIWLRAIQSIMAPALGEAREVLFEAEGDEDLTWQAKWKRTTFPGWKAADEKDADLSLAQDEAESNSDSGSEQAWKASEQVKDGMDLKWITLTAKPQETKPQGRYTEATLVRELEKKGIGRPSTFASLIATLIEKSYVEVKDIPAANVEAKSFTLEKLGQWPPKETAFSLKRGGETGRMIPSPLGKSMLTFAVTNFPDLFAFEFTAGLESRLDKIAEGSESWKQVLGDTWNSYKDRVTVLKTAGSAGGTAGSAGGTGNPRRREFADGLIAVISAKGPLLLKEGATKDATVFYGWPPSKKGFQELTEEEAKAFVATVQSQKQGDVMGEFNGHQVLKKKGPYGLYAECNGVRVNLVEADTLESVIVKLRAKNESPTRTLGPFQIKTGPYGPYLMKVGAAANPAKSKGAKPQCVSIPEGTDLDTLTAQEAGVIFEAGLKAKVSSSKRKFNKKG